MAGPITGGVVPVLDSAVGKALRRRWGDSDSCRLDDVPAPLWQPGALVNYLQDEAPPFDPAQTHGRTWGEAHCW